MRKAKKILEDSLNNFQEIDISQSHLDETIALGRRAYDSRRKMRHLSVYQQLKGQLRFVARPIWALQLVVLAALCLILRVVSADSNFRLHLPTITGVASVFTAMTALPFYGRSRRYNMRELESSTRLSLSRVLLSKACAVGLGDALCLMAAALITLRAVDSPARVLLIYIILPFLLSCTGSLFILNRTRESYGVYIALGYCTAVAAMYLVALPAKAAALMRLHPAFSAAACILLAVLLLFECRRLLRQIPGSDLEPILSY